ncbi:alpha-L-arabinofuranosidase C-terminal domain-containing protein [Burkholderia sp. TSV86]|uniref:alpha-L-arabinofuranosidase C-terminal domain-containing protein n=1 Tax=Burkholderia sp. TSV86 TaxID=1385594 RepID=UPI0007541D2F|nr:alpha-L-arabinofuranosidase C-terminal domain-containing protein [Burkholderia sp. TSV86]KVE36320.1 hypothetical protein WS68_04775 [Burkholderia sp. TSV86]
MYKTRRTQLLAGAFASATLATVIAGCGSSVTSTGKPVVSFDTTARIGTVNPLLFGINHRWLSNGVGTTDPQTGITYPQVSDQIKDIGFTMIRYPAGTLANTFQWERAIGPQAQRGGQVGGIPVASLALPRDSTFGPDEYGNLLDVTGATGDLMLNVATAGPADSANFIAYMTAPQGSAPVNGVDWAAKRAANGHPAPYKIAYAELGNEYDPSVDLPYQGVIVNQTYWINGEPVSFNKPACAANKRECLYAFGGSTRFTAEPAVAQNDWRPETSISSGAAGQVFYARYASVAQASDTVYVNGVAWQSVPDIGTAAGAGNFYQLDNATGAIRFGDGTHGAIPPAGATITVTYTTTHAGFVDHYNAIKAVNPAIKVCSSIFDNTFLKLMGSQYAYDCVAQHLYAKLDASKSTGLSDYFGQVMLSTNSQAAKVQATQAAIKQYAGSRAAGVGMLLSEYGHLGTMPAYAPYFPRSLGEGVMHGLFLRQWMINGIEAADRHVLSDYTYGTAPADLAAISSSDNALLQGPGPNTIESPTALAMKLFTQNTGGTLVRSAVTNNPARTLSDGQTLAALQTVATVDAAGNAYLIVINEDPENAVNALVSPQGLPRSGNSVSVSTLNSANITDENNPANATAVQIARRTVQVGTGSFNWTFPAHSISAIKFSS